MPTYSVEAKLEWRAERGDSERRWVAVCDALGVAAEADSLDELHSVIPETIHLLMVDLLEDGELDQFLSERGWSSSRIDEARTPEVGFHVPWEMIAEGSNGSSRKAA